MPPDGNFTVHVAVPGHIGPGKYLLTAGLPYLVGVSPLVLGNRDCLQLSVD